MQEVLHHGRVIREYRGRLGLTQDELAQRIGRSRRTIITLEQGAQINDPKLRRTLALQLHIPMQLLGLSEIVLPEAVTLTPVEESPLEVARHLSRMVSETFTDNLRMRLDLYYIGSALSADRGLNAHLDELTRLISRSSARDRRLLLILLSHNYQLKGMIARDQLDYEVAEHCFKEASLLAQEAGCPELDALTMARRANMYVWQKRLDLANSLYEAAREITRRSSAALRAYLATGHAEVQSMLGSSASLVSLTDARRLLGRVDPADDSLLLLHSTRCSESSINNGWAQAHTLLGKPEVALECYDRSEKVLDLSMTRMRARLYTQYAEALYVSKDLSCCFYAAEGLKLARSVGSQYNIRRVKELALKLSTHSAQDHRVKELLQAV
jgi:DNA-binding XRE family transcriptional regulator/tetratricopeptide (TPR) repeat protein